MLALILAAQIAAAPAAGVPPPIVILGAQLAGCWEQVRPDGRTVEQWMSPDEGLMLGMSRTTRDGAVGGYEFLLIRQMPIGLEYVAHPSGQAETRFTLKTFTSEETMFENPTHDFPQRIIYRWPDRDKMTARIEGKIDGQARGVDFAYKRCPTGN